MSGRWGTITREERPQVYRCARRGCSNTFVPKKHTPKGRQRFCSPACRITDFDRRRNGRRSRLSRRDECDRGHLKTPENTYQNPNGSLDCRTCRRIAGREAMRRKRGVTPDRYRIKEAA